MMQISDTGYFLKKIFEKNWKTIFLIDSIKNEFYTYGDFFQKITRYREKLEEIGIKNGDYVCLILDNSLELATLYFSSLLLGVKVVPIDPLKGISEVEEIINQINFKKIIYDDKKFENISFGINLKNINHDQNTPDIKSKNIDIFENINYDKDFLITFTSGSSGKQKGVIHSFNNVIKSAIAFNKKFNFDKNSIFYHNLSMSYMAGILNLLILPLVCQSKVIIDRRTNISNINIFWKNIIKYSANTFWLVPTILELLLKLDRGLEGINYTKKNKITICVGTAPLMKKVQMEFEKKYDVKLFESYGISETLFVSTNYYEENKMTSVGKLLDDVTVETLDDGELVIKAPWICKGYHSMNKNKYFKDGKFLSGDLGKFDKSKFLFIVGRKMDIIIKGGVNISPKKIENVILDSKLFNELTLIGFPSKLLGEKIVCFYVPKKIITINDKKTINKKIIERLGMEYRIDEFVELEHITKNLNGKIDKPKIRETFRQRINDS
jgi:long-chain acyl-CoA synthetase